MSVTRGVFIDLNVGVDCGAYLTGRLTTFVIFQARVPQQPGASPWWHRAFNVMPGHIHMPDAAIQGPGLAACVTPGAALSVADQRPDGRACLGWWVDKRGAPFPGQRALSRVPRPPGRAPDRTSGGLRELHAAVIVQLCTQPRSYADCLMVTQITLNTEVPGRGPPNGNRGRGSVPVPDKSGTLQVLISTTIMMRRMRKESRRRLSVYSKPNNCGTRLSV